MKRNPLVFVPALGVTLPRYDKDYLKRIHELPCAVTGLRCDDAHHPKGLGWGCGMGQKAPDATAIPLCKRVHDEYHRVGVKSWEAKYGSHEHLLQMTWRRLGVDSVPV